MGGRTQYNVPPEIENGYLFPNCIVMYGWRHQFDICIQRTLSAFGWYPNWLISLKASLDRIALELNANVLTLKIQYDMIPAQSPELVRCRIIVFNVVTLSLISIASLVHTVRAWCAFCGT